MAEGNITFRGGRRPNDPTKRRIRLTDFVDVDAVAAQLDAGTLPATPSSVNWDAKVSAFGMLGNDDWGDCDWAAKYHGLQVMTANSGVELVPTTDDTLRAYAEGTGFNINAGAPGQNDTDQGTVMQDAFNYWRKIGLPVTNAPGLESGIARYRILAFFEVDHTDPKQLRVAAALFGGVYLGIRFPSSAMVQFNQGRPWTYERGAYIEGGHAIYDAKYDPSKYWPVTWGREQETHQDFLDHYLDEAWGVLSLNWADAAGNTPAGVNLHALGEIFSQITHEPNPISDTPQPPEPPTPHPNGLDAAVVAAVQALLNDPRMAHWALEERHAGDNRHAAQAVAAVFEAAKKTN